MVLDVQFALFVAVVVLSGDAVVVLGWLAM